MEEGYNLERDGDLDSALSLYRKGLKEDSARQAVYQRQIGTVLVKKKDLPGAIEAYDAYLALAPTDTKTKAYNDSLKASIERLRNTIDLEDPYAQFGRPRDKKFFQIMEELLSPVVFGSDLSVYITRHHNVGLGYAFLPAGANAQFYHPRYRYYKARWLWDSFFEVGGLFGGVKAGSGGDSYTVNLSGGDIAYGVNVVTAGWWTQEFMLSLNYLNISETYVDYKGKASNYSVAAPYPLIGWGFGLVF